MMHGQKNIKLIFVN